MKAMNGCAPAFEIISKFLLEEYPLSADISLTSKLAHVFFTNGSKYGESLRFPSVNSTLVIIFVA